MRKASGKNFLYFFYLQQTGLLIGVVLVATLGADLSAAQQSENQTFTGRDGKGK